MIETIHIYHTNDLHSHFEQWPKIAYYLNAQKQVHRDSQEEMFLFDIGDHMDRVHPISEASFGKVNVGLLNRLKYDSVTIGNNEGITLPFDALDGMYKEATFNILVANLFTKDGNHPSWVRPYEIYTLSSGLKMAVIGVTVYYKLFYELLGWMVKDPFVTIERIVSEIRNEVDIIVVLSHLGINDDQLLAERFPDIDVVLGGHTHHLFEHGKEINQSLLCGAGKYGQYFGHVELVIDLPTKKLLHKRAEVIKTEELIMEDEETIQILEKYQNEGITLLSEPIMFLSDDLKIDWFDESPLGNLLASSLKEWCNCDIAMVNAGMILESLPKGPVTRKDIHRICPHPINPCKVQLKGDELKEIILMASTEKVEKLEIKGLGFRGKVMGKMIYDGVTVVTETLSDGLQHVNRIFVNGTPLNLDETYTIATVDMFTFGYLFPEIKDAKHKTFYMPEMLRDLLQKKLEQLDDN